MRSKVADRILAKTPEDAKIFARLYGNLIVRINSVLKAKGYTQKSLAEKLDKNPSEIHKWLSGEHNFTLRSIAKLQAELGEILLEVPMDKPVDVYKPYQGKTTFRVYKNIVPIKPVESNWSGAAIAYNKKGLANVG